MTDALRDPGRLAIPTDPVIEFTDWSKPPAAGASRPDAMCGHGHDIGRAVGPHGVFAGFDVRGWVFYTNYESRKGQEISANPAAALMFYWDAIHRSVRVEGRVEKATAAESERYFSNRPLDSRLGAWASAQSRVIDSRQVLDERMEQLRDQYRDGDVPLPPFWGGYRVVPECIEFWLSRPNRLHDRFCYRKQTDGAWDIVRLSP